MLPKVVVLLTTRTTIHIHNQLKPASSPIWGGIIYGPYTGSYFDSTKETDIEHIVARSEAHDSGLCATGEENRKRFASDLLNLTLASPAVNRHQKSGKDAAEWLPDLNQCWFADRVVRVRQEYELTIDQAEVKALDSLLSACASLDMVVAPATAQTAPTAKPTPSPTPAIIVKRRRPRHVGRQRRWANHMC